MSREIVRQSPARITLSLDIIQKVTKGKFSGYHELGIIKQKLELLDQVSVKEADRFSLSCSDSKIPTDKRNVCTQAYDLLKSRCGMEKSASIYIEKHIPAEGGLAGGSSNAATTLLALNELWGLGLTQSKLISLGREIGMDVPFFCIPDNNAYDTEVTGILEPIETSLRFYFVLVFPSFGVSTQEAYREIDYALIAKDRLKTKTLKEALVQDRKQDIVENIHNDFEISVFYKYPRLRKMKQDILEAGALSVSMTGSGSTLFGIARDRDHAQEIASRLPYKTAITVTRE